MEGLSHDRIDRLYPILLSNADYTPRSTSVFGYMSLGIWCIAVTSKLFDFTTTCLPRLSAV